MLFRSPPSSDFYLTVRGTQGSVAIGWKASFVHRFGEEPVQIAKGYDKAAAHVRMMKEFRNLLLGAAAPWISHDDCLLNSAAIDAAYRSLDSSTWAAVETGARRALAA